MAEPKRDDGPPLYDEFFVADKDPEYVYKWVNSRDRVMLRRHHQGYEVVNTPEEIPEAVRALNPHMQAGGEVTRRRGDLILMRIKRDVHERNVRGPINAARERQSVSLDTMVQQANDQTRKDLRRAGYRDSSIRDSHVFVDTPEPYRQ